MLNSLHVLFYILEASCLVQFVMMTVIRVIIIIVKVDVSVCLQMILRNIVSHSEASVMSDALCVVNSYRHLTQTDAYFFRAVHLLTTR